MKKLIFKPEDFPGDIYSEVYTEISQMLFDKWYASEIESAPTVFKCAGYGHMDKWIEDEKELDTAPTHKARLVGIEVINAPT